MQVSTIS